MSKRMLMISDADSLWTTRILQSIFLPDGWQVVLFPIWGDHGEYAEFYKENNITVYHDTHKLPVIRHIPRLRMHARVRLNARALIALGPFDAVHCQYLSQRDLLLGQAVAKRFHARWVCNFIGSDLLRSSDRERRRMRPCLDECDVLTVSSIAALERVYGARYRGKAVQMQFGTDSFIDIDRVRAAHDKRECKRYFGIDPDSTVVCLGYSASAGQQHLPALQAMKQCKCLNDITLVLQLTYCSSGDDYVAEVVGAAKALGCRLCVLTDFMDAEQSAYLRLAADVFVHSIITDSFSVSMLEYLYAGAVMLRGAWLKYGELDALGIRTAEFNDFDALPVLLDSAVRGDIAPLTTEERQQFNRRYSWDAMREDWLRLYDGDAE